MSEEPAITINGTRLTEAQAATIRCAVEALAASLDDGLGDDEHGQKMVEGYRARIKEIRGMIFHG